MHRANFGCTGASRFKMRGVDCSGAEENRYIGISYGTDRATNWGHPDVTVGGGYLFADLECQDNAANPFRDVSPVGSQASQPTPF